MRYYYDDPLAAAWMVLNFKMRLQKGEAGYGKGTTTFKALLDAELDRAWRYRYYIHPDSLYILEPQVGDLVGWLTLSKAGDKEEWLESFNPFEKLIPHVKSPISRIIQRNGIPFMMPKEEA